MDFAQLYEQELQARQLLSKGVPPGSPCCERHRSDSARMAGEQAAPSTGQPASNSQGTKTTARKSSGLIINDTALLPICYTDACWTLCIEPGEQIQQVDSCQCATNITSSPCWECALEQIEQSKEMAIHERSAQLEGQEETVLLCDCGCGVRGSEGARLCVGCYGLVSAMFFSVDHADVAPSFPSIAGPMVVFKPYTTRVLERFSNDGQAPTVSEIGQTGFDPAATSALIDETKEAPPRKRKRPEAVEVSPPRKGKRLEVVGDADATELKTRKAKTSEGLERIIMPKKSTPRNQGDNKAASRLNASEIPPQDSIVDTTEKDQILDDHATNGIPKKSQQKAANQPTADKSSPQDSIIDLTEETDAPDTSQEAQNKANPSNAGAARFETFTAAELAVIRGVGLNCQQKNSDRPQPSLMYKAFEVMGQNWESLLSPSTIRVVLAICGIPELDIAHVITEAGKIGGPLPRGGDVWFELLMKEVDLAEGTDESLMENEE